MMIPVVPDARIRRWYGEYPHSRAQTELNDQYPVTVYADRAPRPRLALMVTPFSFAYLAGDAGLPEGPALLRALLTEKLCAGDEPLVLFAPDDTWRPLLAEALEDLPVLEEMYLPFVWAGGACHAPQVPETRAARLAQGAAICPVGTALEKGEEVARCTAYRMGAGGALIHVYTRPDKRRRGFGSAAAMACIREILDAGLRPEAGCWPFPPENPAFLRKLGFSPLAPVRAWLWARESREL